MLNLIGVFFTIIGTILGCGFFSGKEIVVFFSKFGYWSFLGILFLFFVLFFLFRFLLNLDCKVVEKVQKSKVFLFINIFVCIVFSSAMIASINESLAGQCLLIKTLLAVVVFVFCLLILFKGGKFLSRLNTFIVPFMIFAFLILLFSNLDLSLPNVSLPSLPMVSIFYSFLYCTLNVATSSMVIANLGSSLSKKQRALIAFLSAFVLMLILFFANIVLLQNQDSFGAVMPFMSIFSVWQKVVLKFNILLGASTTLFSLIYNFNISLRGLCNNFFIFILSIVVPIIVSFWGFENIVCFLYPTASVFSIFILFSLYFEKYNVFVKKIFFKQNE